MPKTPTLAIELDEPEYRFLAGVLVEALPHMTDAQVTIAGRIAEKAHVALDAAFDELVERHGLETAIAIARDIVASHPEANGFEIRT